MQEHDRAVLAAKLGLLAAEAWSMKEKRPYGLVMGLCSREVEAERVFTVPTINCDLDEMVRKLQSQ